MTQLNLHQYSAFYFIGIGGIAMSATACLAKKFGFLVEGSDQAVYHPALEMLADINYHSSYSESNISSLSLHDTLIIVSAGVEHNNPELVFALNHGFMVVSLPEVLYALAEDKIRIVIAGTHGKSTTSGLIGYLFSQLDNSSFMVGGVLRNFNSNYFAGEGNYFVLEGDEYKTGVDDPTPKFHYYKPDILVLTNLEYDHPDMYDSLEALVNEFQHLISNLPPDGLIVYNADDLNLEKLLYNSPLPAFSFGESDSANLKLIQRTHTFTGTSLKFRVKFQDAVTWEEYFTPLLGEMNSQNIAGGITLLRAMGFSAEVIQALLPGFTGIKRRLELLGEVNGARVFDDYAHHPTAIKSTLRALRLHFPDHRILAVFEPHTYTRIHALLPSFGESFNDADVVVLAPIYGARENGANFADLNDRLLLELKQAHQSVVPVSGKNEALKYLFTHAQPSDIIVIMAVGNFHELGMQLTNGQKNEH